MHISPSSRQLNVKELHWESDADSLQDFNLNLNCVSRTSFCKLPEVNGLINVNGKKDIVN